MAIWQRIVAERELPMVNLRPLRGLPRFAVLLVVALALAGLARPALAERRVALVMAAEAYRDLRPLANPVNDAVAIQALLEGLGFEVFLETNRDLRRMRRALEDFEEDAAGADVALVFFAGHGVEIGGRNLLLPVDAGGDTPEALAASALPLEEVVATARRVASTALVLLDACRDDPFGAPDSGDGGSGDGRGATALIRPATGPAVRPGLGRMGRAEGVLFAFAAAPGETASDGTGGNSPFTEGLVAYFGTTGLEVRSALTLVQQEVYDRSRGRQLPYVESGLPRLFFAAESAGDLPERERLLLAMADLTPDLRAEIETVAAARAMPLAPLFGAALSADLAQATPAQRADMLDQAAEAFLKVQQDLQRFSSDDPRVQALRDDAERQLSLGAFATARARLTEAAEIDAESRGAVRDTFVARTLSEAETHLLNASAARADLRLALAIEDLGRATALYAEVEPLGIDRRAMEQHTKALWDLGEMHLRTGNTDAAMATFQRWTDVATARAEADPTDPEWQRDMAASWSLAGNVLMEQGDLDGAHAAYLASREIFAGLAKRHPETALWQRDVAAADVLLGDISGARADWAAAARFHRTGRDGLAARAAADPGNLDWQADLNSAQLRLGYSLLWAAETQAGLAELAANLTHAQELALAHPVDPRWQVQLIQNHLAMATSHNLSGAVDAALEQIGKAEAISAALTKRAPDNAEWQRDYVAVLQNKGDLLAQTDPKGAMAAYQGALDISRWLADLDARNASQRRGVAVLLGRIGELAAQQGDDVVAAAAISETIDIAEALVALSPENLIWQQDLAFAYRRAGDRLRGIGDTDGAERAFERALSLSEDMLAQAGDPFSALLDLSQLHDRLGRLYLEAGDPVRANAAWESRRAATERLAKHAPENPVALLELVSALHALGTISEKPRAYYERALGIVLGLEAAGSVSPGANGWTEYLREAIASLPQ